MELTATTMPATTEAPAAGRARVSPGANGFAQLLQTVRVDAVGDVPEFARSIQPMRTTSVVISDAAPTNRPEQRPDDVAPAAQNDNVDASAEPRPTASDSDVEPREQSSARGEQDASDPEQQAGATDEDSVASGSAPQATAVAAEPVPVAAPVALPIATATAPGAQAVAQSSAEAPADAAVPLVADAGDDVPDQAPQPEPLAEMADAEVIVPNKTALGREAEPARQALQSDAGQFGGAAQVSLASGPAAEATPVASNAGVVATQALLAEQAVDEQAAATPTEGASAAEEGTPALDLADHAPDAGEQGSDAGGANTSAKGQHFGMAVAAAPAAGPDRAAGTAPAAARADTPALGVAAGAQVAGGGKAGFAPATAAARTHRGHASPADQVRMHLPNAVREGKDVIHIQLSPESLGRVEVRLELQDGRVHARITAESREAMQLLQQDSRSLERAFQEAGLRTDGGSLSFDLREDRGAWAGGGNGGRKGGANTADPEVRSDAPAATAAASRGVVRSDRVDISV